MGMKNEMTGGVKIRIDTKPAEVGLGRLSQMVWEMMQAAEAAAKGQTALAKATAAAGKAAKGALAAFDELNVLELKSGGVGGGSGGKPEKPPEPPEAESGQGQIGFLQELLAALEPLTQELFAGLRWGYENVLLPLAQWAAGEALPGFLSAVGAAAGFLAGVLELLKPVGIWLWESFLQPLGQWTGEMVLTALAGIAGAFEALSGWIDLNQEKLAGLWEGLEPMFTALCELTLGMLDSLKAYFELWLASFTELLTGALDFWLAMITGDWQGAWEAIQAIFETYKNFLLGSLGILWEGMKNGFGKALEAVKLLWAPVGEWFMQTVLSPLQKNFAWLWDGVTLAAKTAWQAVLGVWEPLSGWFMEKVAAPVSSLVKGLWESITGHFSGGVDTLKNTLRGYVNFCLDMAEGAANLFIGLFNGVISALNRISVEIPDWVPEYGGNSFGISIPKLPAASIPRLATGAIIPPNAQFAAILGDQRSGRNLEAPEELIREIVREESGGQEIVIRFEGSMAQLARLLTPALSQENARQGARLVVEGNGY